MTCIIAYKTKDKIYMGSDSAVVVGGNSGEGTLIRTMTEPPKVFHKEGLLIGFAGTPRFGQIVRDCFYPTPLGKNENIVTYLTTTFVNELIKTLDELKHLEIRTGEACGYQFLVGAQGRFFKISVDFAVIEVDDAFTAIGSGEDYALGALAALKDAPELNIKEIIRYALEITARYCPSVREPFTIIES